MLPQQGNDLKSDRTFLSGPTVFHSSTLKANLHAAICRADLSATTNQGANRRV